MKDELIDIYLLIDISSRNAASSAAGQASTGVQVNYIIQAVKSRVPQPMWAEIVEKLEQPEYGILVLDGPACSDRPAAPNSTSAARS